MMLAADESDGRVRQTSLAQHDAATSEPVMSSTAAAAAGGNAGHYSVTLPHEPSSLDNEMLSWTSAEVTSWLERSRLQHLADWYVSVYVCM